MRLIEKHCWAEIDVEAIKHNYNLIVNTFKNPCYVVLKADAYGHGAVYLAKIYQELDCFGIAVATFSEAEQLRKNGITKPILILGYTSPDLARDLFKLNLTQTVFSLEYARKLNAHALYPVDCHIKLDTGMGRLGFDLSNDVNKAYEEIYPLLSLYNLKFSGVFSHFSSSDATGEKELIFTDNQIKLFDNAVKNLQSHGFEFKYIHLQNSAGIARKLNNTSNIVRAGIVLYGHNPSDEVILPEIRPAMQLKTIVTHIKQVNAGQSIGYGMQFTAIKPTKIATIACGYADGVPRQLNHTGHTVYINGNACNVVGRICMDQIMVDVTDIDVNIEDEVTVLGGQEQASFDVVASKVGTVNYQILCGIHKRVPRVYTQNNRIINIEYGI